MAARRVMSELTLLPNLKVFIHTIQQGDGSKNVVGIYR
jgi:hypothetical protein